MMELAEKRNSIPLPSISNEYGVRLPPAQYQLMTHESERQDMVSLEFLEFVSWLRSLALTNIIVLCICRYSERPTLRVTLV